ncbi:DUF968 domain-containing protein [Acinetobacter seifertii]|uniref:DUF968 domain-containing protein n=1 Tax=Acinetobacter seifertii TaxID=1530123 RepID=A0A7H2VFE5_9GAMM|nr:DUF968 domain-containing protein [Acinetobacter seifertii]MBD1220513.1 DUF968 domain-containing protein [Acinetobacter seifertii]MBD1225154.1 DUF968 domain-containing protein [Acinetobacter seifertii]QNX13189.1 DUF968 domain-containing protein [Acinetobacter seifertii]QNX18779.1 DUF968 domain-containing protein [Acinetobacter seifertii]QNX36411.1 DUF968 domain-containing protein [Acinetobacter seifertii]
MRDAKRLKAVRLLPCVRCGQSPSQAAHSNSSKHGKGRSIKASDEFTIPLCHSCHSQFDQFKLGTRQESETMFERWLKKTELMLKIDTKSDDVF